MGGEAIGEGCNFLWKRRKCVEEKLGVMRYHGHPGRLGWKTGKTSSRPCGVLLLLTPKTKVTRTVGRLVRPMGLGPQKWT